MGEENVVGAVSSGDGSNQQLPTLFKKRHRTQKWDQVYVKIQGTSVVYTTEESGVSSDFQSRYYFNTNIWGDPCPHVFTILASMLIYRHVICFSYIMDHQKSYTYSIYIIICLIHEG